MTCAPNIVTQHLAMRTCNPRRTCTSRALVSASEKECHAATDVNGVSNYSECQSLQHTLVSVARVCSPSAARVQHPQPAGGEEEEGVSLLSRSCHDTNAIGSSARGSGSQLAMIHAPARRLTSPRLSYLRAQHGVIRVHCPFGHLHVWNLCDDISSDPHRCTGRDTHIHTRSLALLRLSIHTHSQTHTHSPPLLVPLQRSIALHYAVSTSILRTPPTALIMRRKRDREREPGEERES